METEEEWNIDCSDDENYGFSQYGDQWLPPAQDIVRLYEKLAKGEKLELEWKCVAKRPPTPEVDDVCGSDVKEEEQTTEENKHEVTEFDFDEGEFDADITITPKRTPASVKAPKSQKRVARLDKIMDDMFRHKKLNAEARAGLSGSSPAHDRILNEVMTHKSPRASPKASPRHSPKHAVGFPLPRGSPRPFTASPKSSSAHQTDTPLRDSPKNKMSPKRLS